jgi:hypothetical protein
MKGIRGALVVALAVILLGVGALATEASAGGSTFSFNQRWVVPGQRVMGTAQFSDWKGASAHVGDGPFFAYLVRGDRFLEPRLLRTHGIRLGPIAMTQVSGDNWEASIQFMVPRVGRGHYTVGLCNDPCRSTFVGDLVGAWIVITGSAEEAKLNNLAAKVEERISQQVSDMTSDLQQQLEGLRESVAAEHSPTRPVAAEMRLARVESRTMAIEARLRPLQARNDPGLTAWLWLIGWLVAGGIAAAWWKSTVRAAGSRRRPPASGGERAALAHVERSEHAHPWRETSRASGVGGDFSRPFRLGVRGSFERAEL